MAIPEPLTSTSTGGVSLVVVAVSLLGPVAGPYAVIVFSSLAGALWPLGAAQTLTKKAGAWLLLRCTLTSIVLTSMIASVLGGMYDTPPVELLGPVALGIGAMGNGWQPVFGALSEAMTVLTKRLGGKGNE